MICPDSYNCCATRIVLETEKPNLRDASCCNVDVVKGADGVRFAGFFCKSFTLKAAPIHVSKKLSASFKVENSFVNVAFNVLPSLVSKTATNL